MSCATEAICVPREISIFPPSGNSSPVMSLNSVDLPHPFSPTTPTFKPSGRSRLAFSNRVRSPKWKDKSLISIM